MADKKMSKMDKQVIATLTKVQTMILEADHFFNRSDYPQAASQFSRAIDLLRDLEHDSKQHHILHCLVSLSKAKLLAGDVPGALAAADQALEDSKNHSHFFKIHCEALLRKADAHVNLGDFEGGLVQYNRGILLEPKDPTPFIQGINKCVDAIRHTLDAANPADMREIRNAKNGQASKPKSHTKSKKDAKSDPHAATKPKTKRYLSELQEDMDFLSTLLQDPVLNVDHLQTVRSRIKQSVDYLSMRSEFWRLKEF